MQKSRIYFLMTVMLIAGGIPSFSQEYRVGGSAIYNLKNSGIGFGLRAEFPILRIDLLEGLSVVPQASYFPGFNDVEEFYLGSSLHLGMYSWEKWLLYGMVNASYKGWANHDDSGDPNAKFSNLALDGGVGITRNTCWRPFLELRLNTIGFEPNIRMGILYTVHCENRGMVPCSKVPVLPQF
jgi:hypothetical protein